MDTATLALLLSILSLLFSLYTSIVSRRTAQLQKLANVRSKLHSLKLNIFRQLTAIQKLNDASEWSDTESISTDAIEKQHGVLTQLEQSLEIAFKRYSRLPLTFPTGLIEETEHLIDCMVSHHDLWEKDFSSRINLLIEKLSKQARVQ